MDQTPQSQVSIVATTLILRMNWQQRACPETCLIMARTFTTSSGRRLGWFSAMLPQSSPPLQALMQSTSKVIGSLASATLGICEGGTGPLMLPRSCGKAMENQGKFVGRKMTAAFDLDAVVIYDCMKNMTAWKTISFQSEIQRTLMMHCSERKQ